MQRKNQVFKLEGGMVRIEFAKPIPEKVITELCFIIGNRRGSAILEDKQSNRVIGVICDPKDWEDFLRAHAKGKRADRLVEDFRSALKD